MVRKTKIVNISLSPEIYRLANKLAQRNQVSRSELFRKALKQYIFSEKRWDRIRRWGAETARRAKIKDEKELYRLLSDWRK